MNMPDVKALRRQRVRDKLDEIVRRVNAYLQGKKLASIKPILQRLGRNRFLPHWFDRLNESGTLPNMDGKTVGSVVEMLFVADVERNVLTGNLATAMTINPAKGVDVPDLDLGIKSPSENWCTSEPFSNAYERLLGPEFDVIAVITNYQTVKDRPPLRIQLIRHNYFKGHQVADKGLTSCARKIRARLLEFGESPGKKAFRFLAYAVQSDWLCKQIVKLMAAIANPSALPGILETCIADFERSNRNRKIKLPLDQLQLLVELRKRKPLDRSIVDLADDWVVLKWREAARLPNENEWNRLLRSPLDGELGVSFALQWRYNFGVFFKGMAQDPEQLKEQ
jgi:hypothetical protein